MRTAYRCRAYPDQAQQQMLSRTFGCVRVVWNRTLAARQARWQEERKRGGELWLAKMPAPLRFVWTWPGIDLTALDPTSVTVTRDPAGRWFVTFHVDVPAPAPLPATGQDMGSMLEYKAERYGRQVVIIDRWHPSSRTCSACGHLLATLSLETRRWTCPGCGTRHDRDVNAAKNILAAGRAADACGADVRHGGVTLVQSAMNQEPRPVREGTPAL